VKMSIVSVIEVLGRNGSRIYSQASCAIGRA
jgi:hypothetical protein